MGHLPDNGLVVWHRGEQLTADGLNGNFATLREYAERALTQALMPDPAVVALEMRLGRIENRLASLEDHVTRSARERGEMEWTPLAYFGGMLQRLDGLQELVEAAASTLQETFRKTERLQTDQDRRLQVLEQQPEAAEAEAFRFLELDYQEMARVVRGLVAETREMREMLAYVKRTAEGSDREANRQQYTPLAVTAEMLKRLEALEAA